MTDEGNSAVLGVQFADGRVIERDEWPAYQAEETRQTREAQRAVDERAKRPPRPVREIRSPLPWAFPDETITVDVGEPPWLGIGILP